MTYRENFRDVLICFCVSGNLERDNEDATDKGVKGTKMIESFCSIQCKCSVGQTIFKVICHFPIQKISKLSIKISKNSEK